MQQTLCYFFRIWLFTGGATQKIVHADTVQVCKLYQCIYRIVQHADFVLGVGILADAKLLCNLLLSQIVVNPQGADVFKFQNFVTHIITRYQITISENKIFHSI